MSGIVSSTSHWFFFCSFPPPSMCVIYPRSFLFPIIPKLTCRLGENFLMSRWKTNNPSRSEGRRKKTSKVGHFCNLALAIEMPQKLNSWKSHLKNIYRLKSNVREQLLSYGCFLKIKSHVDDFRTRCFFFWIL